MEYRKSKLEILESLITISNQKNRHDTVCFCHHDRFINSVLSFIQIMFGGMFGGKKPDPKEKVREWTNELKKEQRAIQRDLANMQREEAKSKAEMKRLAKQPNASSQRAIRILAKSVVGGRKTSDKLQTANAQINSVILNLKTQAATVNVAGHMAKSTAVMSAMSQLIKLDAVSATTKNLSREMMKMGIMDEMMTDALSVTDDDDLESEADAEVDRVLYEVTEGQFGSIAAMKDRKAAEEDVKEDDQKQTDQLQERMAKLGA